MSSQRPHIKTGIASLGTVFLIAFGLLLFGRCDSSFVPEPSYADSDHVQKVRQWYEETLLEHQDALRILPDSAAGKINDDSTMMAVQAEMVRQYPPDWDQAVVWPNGSGGFYAATILGPDKPATSFSHDSIAVVRTLVADLDNEGEITGGRLVEFISPDPLDPSSLADYVKQWLGDDFGNTKIIAAEYTIGYESLRAYKHSPGEDPVKWDMRLEGVAPPGKTAATIYCWVSDVDVDWLCKYDSETDTFYDCVPYDYTIEVTCVIMGDGDGGGGGGGGGGGDGDCPPGDWCDPPGGGGGGEEEEEEEEEEECDCSNEDQCELAVEYDDSVNWPCSKFHIVEARFYQGAAGTHNGKHSGYGYIDPAMPTGYGSVEAHFRKYHTPGGGFIIGSTWRCPVGNANINGATQSQHLYGTAIDFTGYHNGVVWPNGRTDYKVEIGDWAERHAGAGYFEYYSTKTHVHLDWR